MREKVTSESIYRHYLYMEKKYRICFFKFKREKLAYGQFSSFFAHHEGSAVRTGKKPNSKLEKIRNVMEQNQTEEEKDESPVCF
jgi:hypothetical protein